MVGLRKNAGERSVDGLPLGEQQFEHSRSLARKLVEPLGALVFLTPLADQEALRFKASQQRVEGAFLYEQSLVLEHPAERVAVLLDSQSREDRHREAAAPHLEAEVVVEAGIRELVTVRHILSVNYYTSHSM